VSADEAGINVRNTQSTVRIGGHKGAKVVNIHQENRYYSKKRTRAHTTHFITL
jgi:hypothetical protein